MSVAGAPPHKGLHAPHTCTAATMLRTHARAFRSLRCLPRAPGCPSYATLPAAPSSACLPVTCTAWPPPLTLGMQQHAVNAVMMLGELLLNRIPGEPLGGEVNRQPNGQ